MLYDKIIPKVRLERVQWVGSKLSFQHQHSGLQLSIIQVPRDLKPSSGFHGHCIHVMHTHEHGTYIYTHVHILRNVNICAYIYKAIRIYYLLFC